MDQHRHCSDENHSLQKSTPSNAKSCNKEPVISSEVNAIIPRRSRILEFFAISQINLTINVFNLPIKNGRDKFTDTTDNDKRHVGCE